MTILKNKLISIVTRYYLDATITIMTELLIYQKALLRYQRKKPKNKARNIYIALTNAGQFSRNLFHVICRHK